MHFIFPSNFVYWEKVANHEKIKEQLLPTILEKQKETEATPGGWQCKVNTSFGQNTEFNRFLFQEEIIKELIWNPMDNMYSQLGDIIPIAEQSMLEDGWYSVYDNPVDHQEMHHHLSDRFGDGGNYFTSYSAIYLLRLQEEKNSTVFYSRGPHTGMDPWKSISYNPADDNPIEEGTVFIFPSHLMHCVNPSPNSRITVSYNIASKL